jgi:hypothetical protein
MPELMPSPQPVGFPVEVIQRAPSYNEVARWQRLLREHDRATSAVDRAGLLLHNIYLTWTFANDAGVSLPAFDPELESQYFEARNTILDLTKAIRLVQDKQAGIRPSGASDLDIVEPQQSLSGLIIPVIVGIVILAGAIGTAIYQSSVVTKLGNEYRKILFDTNKIFCKNPSSNLCKKWIAYKEQRKYDQTLETADSLGETLKKGVKTVAGGLATGLLVAVAAIAFMRFSK